MTPHALPAPFAFAEAMSFSHTWEIHGSQTSRADEISPTGEEGVGGCCSAPGRAAQHDELGVSFFLPFSFFPVCGILKMEMSF